MSNVTIEHTISKTINYMRVRVDTVYYSVSVNDQLMLYTSDKQLAQAAYDYYYRLYAHTIVKDPSAPLL